jgi:hypothetical protein
MASSHRSGDTFLVCLYTSTPDGEGDFVECTEQRGCVESITRARSWYGQQPEGRRAEVWIGDINVFDSDLVVYFDERVRARCAPLAPGRYGYEWTADGNDYRYVLMKP